MSHSTEVAHCSVETAKVPGEASTRPGEAAWVRRASHALRMNGAHHKHMRIAARCVYRAQVEGDNCKSSALYGFGIQGSPQRA